MGLDTRQTVAVCFCIVAATVVVVHQSTAFITPYAIAARHPAHSLEAANEGEATGEPPWRTVLTTTTRVSRGPPPSSPPESDKKVDGGGTAVSRGSPPSNRARTPLLSIANAAPSSLRDLSAHYLGCFSVSTTERVLDIEATKPTDHLSPASCAELCAEEGYSFFELAAPQQCWCGERAYPEERRVPDDECKRPCPGDASQSCGGPGCVSVYRLKVGLPPPLTFFIEPAKNRNSFFLTGRVKRWASGRYTYRLAVLNHRLTSNAENFRYEMCIRTPGMKIFIGHGELLLRNWPGNAVMLITGDEAGDWGLVRNNKYYGLHGPEGLLPSNESHPLRHIIMPPFARPWFRQYYDKRQIETFGRDARYFPLGPRHEFPVQVDGNLTPSSARRYTYMLIAAATDPSRQRLHDLLEEDALIPGNKRFLHLAKQWQANANGGDYVAPAEYGQIMKDSAFALCPKGHSADQFRLYEAMESNTIPVLENKGGYLADKLPPEYLESPMLFVDEWADAPRAMAALAADPSALDERQRRLKAWYEAFMRAKMQEIEDAAHDTLSRHDREAQRTCSAFLNGAGNSR